ncbi:BMA_0021/BMA_0022 family TOMM bacteriocin [Pseudoalteromonas byunsanensis]|uniref:Uncharacterized protein n=1 Tax=Pseudoalteromonas byunsanensis TaxID=327939 RepID=A0A1S1N0L7_9GAMM|nr:BMA_0021/BMA_0022 family TOMM bacteriocin [Pseudoalteromonas byunsanensis]OHU94578.1 hypothetical protein BIW53_16085 [Pseudoalteromonas byunsanensis]
MSENNEKQYLSFRSAFIGAIARSWYDEEYKEKFTSAQSSQGKGLLNFLQENPASESTRFFNPWKNLAIQFRYPKLVWNPVDGHKWLGDNSGIILNIPKIPDDREKSAELLARYYNVFPTFYGLIKTPIDAKLTYDTLSEEHRCIAALKDKDSAPLSEYSRLTNLYDVDMVGYTDETMRHFSAVVMEAVALYWRSEEFRNELTPEGEDGRLDVEGYVSDKSPVLSKWLDFKNPWNMNIMFRYDKNFTLESGDIDKDYIPDNIICLAYPEAPSNEQDKQSDLLPMALANYNQDGSILPFSCS